MEMTRGMTTCIYHKHWKSIIIAAQVYTSFVQKKRLTSGVFFWGGGVEFNVDFFKIFLFCPKLLTVGLTVHHKVQITTLVGIRVCLKELCQCYKAIYGMLMET